jgi:hypothetical protein
MITSSPLNQPWLARVRAGDFSALPEPLRYKDTLHFSHLLNGYFVSEDMNWPLLRIWANERRDEAEQTGSWRGTALELWCCLFYERRRYRHGGEGDPTGLELVPLDRLCATLREKLQSVTAGEHALILHFMAQPTTRDRSC